MLDIKNIKITNEAKLDLQNIINLNIDIRQLRYLNSFTKEFVEKLELINKNPQMYNLIEDVSIKEMQCRKFAVKDYIVFYSIQKKYIYILRILHKRKSYENLK